MMSEELDIAQALNEAIYKCDRLMEENEQMREQLAKIKFAATSLEAIKNATRIAFRDPYFWCGYFLAMIVMLLVGLIWKGKDR